MATEGMPSTAGTPTTWQGTNNSTEDNKSRDPATAGSQFEVLEIPVAEETSAAVRTVATAVTLARMNPRDKMNIRGRQQQQGR